MDTFQSWGGTKKKEREGKSCVMLRTDGENMEHLMNNYTN